MSEIDRLISDVVPEKNVAVAELGSFTIFLSSKSLYLYAFILYFPYHIPQYSCLVILHGDTETSETSFVNISISCIIWQRIVIECEQISMPNVCLIFSSPHVWGFMTYVFIFMQLGWSIDIEKYSSTSHLDT
ncbi:hypothetical protein ACJX0J_028696, partial [Zea mays]